MKRKKFIQRHCCRKQIHIFKDEQESCDVVVLDVYCLWFCDTLTFLYSSCTVPVYVRSAFSHCLSKTSVLFIFLVASALDITYTHRREEEPSVCSFCFCFVRELREKERETMCLSSHIYLRVSLSSSVCEKYEGISCRCWEKGGQA